MTKNAYVDFQDALRRLAAKASDQDPIYLVYDNGTVSVEMTPRDACARSEVRHAAKEDARRLDIRFWGDARLAGYRGDHRLLQGTLRDMVREREGRSHGAVPVPYHAAGGGCCSHDKPKPEGPRSLDNLADEVAAAFVRNRVQGVQRLLSCDVGDEGDKRVLLAVMVAERLGDGLRAQLLAELRKQS